VYDGRKRTARTLATISIAAFGSSLFVAAPTQAMPASPDAPTAPHKPQKHKKKHARHKAPKPTIDNTQPRADRLNHQADQVTGQFNAARHQMRDAKKRLHQLQASSRYQQKQAADLRAQLAADVSPQYHDQRTQMMVRYARRADRLDQRRADARSNLALVTVTKRRLGVQKAVIDHKASKVNDLLSQLKERAAEQASRSEERTATQTTDTPTTDTPAASSGAAAAVQYAMSKVGDAYVYGAAGPSSFDCSGLTMAAWQQAGVSLPHSSSAQMGSGTPVSQSELQPGDLVFYYSPVSHVGMYIGNGQIVNAENPSVGVKITGVNSMPYAGAVRPG
jgi:cell wall-associated NlpC family hydrolase